jgi:AcrR family transcriptional regulator
MAPPPPAPRQYTKRKRAEAQDRTRARIVAATVALHEELGPRHASISAIAERAGVQRLTVYRHFPDEAALFHACTSDWLARHPPPPLVTAGANEAPAAVARRALEALYRYYRETQAMWTVTHRDLDDVPALAAPMAQFNAYLGSYREALTAAWGRRAQRQAVQATAALAVHFLTWRSLADAGLDDGPMARLVAGWLALGAQD